MEDNATVEILPEHGSGRPAFFTTREAAACLGISIRTAQCWCEQGILESWKTGGGHRRVTKHSVEKLLRDGDRSSPIPRVSHEHAERRVTQQTSSVGGDERFTILVIEDDNVLLKLYRMRIEKWGLPVDVHTTTNGFEGLILMGRELPDLMIVDLSMSSLNGFDLIRMVTGSAFREGMEVAVVTGVDESWIAARGGLPDGVALFRKPVPFDAIRKLVEKLLERRNTL